MINILVYNIVDNILTRSMTDPLKNIVISAINFIYNKFYVPIKTNCFK